VCDQFRVYSIIARITRIKLCSSMSAQMLTMCRTLFRKLEQTDTIKGSRGHAGSSTARRTPRGVRVASPDPLGRRWSDRGNAPGSASGRVDRAGTPYRGGTGAPIVMTRKDGWAGIKLRQLRRREGTAYVGGGGCVLPSSRFLCM
jgi:hypothetical protein